MKDNRRNEEQRIADRLRELAEGFEGYNLNYVLDELSNIEDMVLALSQMEITDEL